tara:strand:+ start:25243 stop:25662 length:420 start_codon:yes stop_codon:yes gene_type:complete
MAKRFKTALWEVPEEKKRIRAREITPDGSRELVVDPADKETYEAVLAEFSADEITARTEEDIKRFRQHKHEEEQHHKEMQEREMQEALFIEKLSVMEIDEIKNTTNKKLKRRIRKAKNFAELYVYGAAVVADYDKPKDL